jgi:iron(III) transport system substrate-binding protein
MKRLILGLMAGLLASSSFASDKLIIISPHRKSIQDEFVPLFRNYYKATYQTDVVVEWLDQGGTSDDIRFIRAKFDKNAKTSGVDIFWGGGATAFLELEYDKLLAEYKLPADLSKEVPKDAAGVSLSDKSKTWYATALSSFGIFFNKKIVKMDRLPEPGTWDDLAKPEYKGQLSLTDPRRSGTAAVMNTIIMQSRGWDQGWELLARIAGNTRSFTHSSSDPIKAVVSGDAAASMAIDFYATPKVADLGEKNLGFVLPAGQTILDPDPVAILRGAPNRQVAERFINWVLSAPAQKVLMLPKGSEGGPKLESLGRMAVNTKAYEETEGKRMQAFNPFKQSSFLKVDLGKAAKVQRVFNDLIGATQIDTHPELKAAWNGVVKRGLKPEEVKTFAQAPITETELHQLAAKWDDDVLRNRTINAWVEFAKTKFQKLSK